MPLAIAAAAGLFLVAAPSSVMANPACVETTVTAPAAADTWLDENSVFNSGGSDAVLMVRSGVPAKNARALIRFPLPSAVPAGCVVESAKLRMFSPSGAENSRLEAVRAAFGWSESLASWSDQPPTVGAPSVTWGGEGFIQWNVTSHVQGMIGGANHGWLIRHEIESAEDGEEQSFHSREKSDDPPQLVIRFDAPPPDGPPPPPADPVPATVHCGQELTRSVRLTNDLTNCPGDGLVIGDARIIVDLDGHTIDGVGLGTGVYNDGYDSVTVRNGIVQDFDYGVQLRPETGRNLVERIRFDLNQIAGVELTDAGGPAAGNEVRHNTVERNGDGIALRKGTSGTLVTGNTMTANGGPGLLVAQSDSNRLEDNSVSGSGDLGVGLEHASDNVVLRNTVSSNSDGGIELMLGSNGNRIEGNTVTESGDTGILVSESDRNVLVGNLSQLMSDSGIGLDLANHGVVRGNDVRFNPGGIQMDGSIGNLVKGNDASETFGIGIELGGGSFENRLVANTAQANGAIGIYLSDEAIDVPGNRVERNVASGNAADGIVTAKGGHTLTFNVTHDNGGWGINAAPGTIDGRGNVAMRNGNSAQCIGMVCNTDATPPDTSLGGRPDDPTSSPAANFTFDGTDDRPASDVLRFQCRLDGGSFVACTSPRAIDGLGEGPHTFEVRAVDQAGNVDPTPASHTWTVDRTAPGTTIDDGPPDPTNSTDATFPFRGEDDRTAAAALRFECRLDAEAFDTCSSPEAYTGLAEGPHTFEVRAIDAAGNVDGSPATHVWFVDRTAPETTIDDGPDAETDSDTATLSFDGEDDHTDDALRFECRLDEEAFGECASPRTYTGLSEGAHTFEVRAIDEAGNVDGSPAGHAWTVVAGEPEPPDTTAPETTLTGVPPDPTNSRSASFAFTGADDRTAAAALRFQCRLDDSAFGFVDCASPRIHADLADGSHTFEVRAVDEAGNLDESPATHTWIVDTVAPETTVDSGPPARTSSTEATFTFAADSEGASFDCSLDGATFAACESPRVYTGLGEGSHEFRVRARDGAGNVGSSAAGWTWTVDTTAPQTTIDSAPAATTSSTSASFAFSASEMGSRFQCRLDSESFADCASPRTYSGLGMGSHTFAVQATDQAGNLDGSPATHTWTITAPPNCTAPPVTLGAQADGWLLQSSASSNYGNDSVLKVDTKSGGNARAIVRFALPAAPPGCQVVDAKLRLFANSHKTGRTLQALRVAAAWTESTVTWNNQPATTGAAATVPSGPGYLQWTVTTQVQAMYSSANHGFLVRDAVENAGGIEQAFNSREKGNDNPPRLVLTFGPG